MMHHQRVGRS